MTASKLRLPDRVGDVFLVDLVLTMVMVYCFGDVELIPCSVGSWKIYGCAVVESSLLVASGARIW